MLAAFVAVLLEGRGLDCSLVDVAVVAAEASIAAAEQEWLVVEELRQQTMRSIRPSCLSRQVVVAGFAA